MEKIENDRDATIKAIRAALQKRSGKAWSVTGGRGTAWGWIHIDAPPARRTWKSVPKPHNVTNEPGRDNWDEIDTGEPGHHTGPGDRIELAGLLGKSEGQVNGGIGVPASSDYRREYIDRANGREPTKIGEPYWD